MGMYLDLIEQKIVEHIAADDYTDVEAMVWECIPTDRHRLLEAVFEDPELVDSLLDHSGVTLRDAIRTALFENFISFACEEEGMKLAEEMAEEEEELYEEDEEDEDLD